VESLSSTTANSSSLTRDTYRSFGAGAVPASPSLAHSRRCSHPKAWDSKVRKALQQGAIQQELEL